MSQEINSRTKQSRFGILSRCQIPKDQVGSNTEPMSRPPEVRNHDTYKHASKPASARTHGRTRTRQAGKQAGRQADRQEGSGQAGKQASGQAGKWAGGQAGKQASWQPGYSGPNPNALALWVAIFGFLLSPSNKGAKRAPFMRQTHNLCRQPQIGLQDLDPDVDAMCTAATWLQERGVTQWKELFGSGAHLKNGNVSGSLWCVGGEGG